MIQVKYPGRRGVSRALSQVKRETLQKTGAAGIYVMLCLETAVKWSLYYADTEFDLHVYPRASAQLRMELRMDVEDLAASLIEEARRRAEDETSADGPNDAEDDEAEELPAAHIATIGHPEVRRAG